VVQAVRAAGKQGNLAAAAISAEEIQALGLVLIKTRGGTPGTEVNDIHFEARLPLLRRLFLRLRGLPLHD
jgi:hypothetical protein